MDGFEESSIGFIAISLGNVLSWMSQHDPELVLADHDGNFIHPVMACGTMVMQQVEMSKQPDEFKELGNVQANWYEPDELPNMYKDACFLGEFVFELHGSVVLRVGVISDEELANDVWQWRREQQVRPHGLTMSEFTARLAAKTPQSMN